MQIEEWDEPGGMQITPQLIQHRILFHSIMGCCLDCEVSMNDRIAVMSSLHEMSDIEMVIFVGLMSRPMISSEQLKSCFFLMCGRPSSS